MSIAPSSPLPQFDSYFANDSTSPSQSGSSPTPAGPQISAQPTPFGNAPSNTLAYASAPPSQRTTSESTQASATANASLQQRVQELDHAPTPPTPQASLSKWLHQALQDKYGQDIDPDTTNLVSLNYNTGGQAGQGPYPGQVVRKESLTNAAMNNSQHADTGTAGSAVVPYRPGGPDIQLTDALPIKLPNKLGDLVNLPLHAHDELGDYTYTYEGIYPQGDPPRYDHTTQLPLDPQDFRAMVWGADPSKVVDAQLNAFWSEHGANYAQQARVAYFGVADASIPETPVSNAKPGDLLPGDGTLASALLAPTADPGVERGQLSIYNYAATDVLYARDKATGRILLYTPGDGNQLHGFDSTDALKTWLAQAMKDPAKRTAFAAHFSAYDRPDAGMVGYSGVDSALVGIANYPDSYAPAGRKWHGGQWNPEQMVTLDAKDGDPFASLAARVKQRSYDDAKALVTANRDVTQKNILKWANIIGTVLGAAMIPLSTLTAGARTVMSLLTAADLANGGTNVAIGLDERSRNKPGWADDVMNGIMQSALATMPALLKKSGRVQGDDAAGTTGTSKNPTTGDTPAPTGKPSSSTAGGTSSLPKTSAVTAPDGMEPVIIAGDPTSYFAYRTIDGDRPRELYTIDKDGVRNGTGKFIDADGERVQTKGGGPVTYLKSLLLDVPGRALAKNASKFSLFTQGDYIKEIRAEGNALGACQGCAYEAVRRIDQSHDPLRHSGEPIDLYQAVKDMKQAGKSAASKEDMGFQINKFQDDPNRLQTRAYEPETVPVEQADAGKPLGDIYAQPLTDMQDGDIATVGLRLLTNANNQPYAGHVLVVQRKGTEYELFDPNNGVFKYPDEATLRLALNDYGAIAFADRNVHAVADSFRLFKFQQRAQATALPRS